MPQYIPQKKKKEGKDENKKILDNRDNYLSNLEISSQQALCALLKER